MTTGALQEDLTLLVSAAPASNHSAGWIWVSAGLGVLLGIGWWRWSQQRARKPAPAIPRDAAQEALRALDRWELRSVEQGRREAVAGISMVVRTYVESRFAVRAPAMTTEEFLTMQQVNRLPEVQAAFWAEFFAVSAPVTYAGMTPDADQFKRFVAITRDFVRNSALEGPA